MVPRQRRISQKYIYKYKYQYTTQSGDRAINQSYKVQKPPTESDCKYYQSALLNLSTIYKQNDVVIVNPNNYKEKLKIHIHKSIYVHIHDTHIYTHIY